MDQDKALKALSPTRVWISVLIGLSLVVLVAARDKNLTQESFWLMAEISVPAILLALVVLFVKDGLNTARIRVLSESSFSWKSALYVILLWEFATAVTPPLFGPMALVIFVLFKEGVSIGKAFAYAMLLAMLDNFFFLTAMPLAWVLSDGRILPATETGFNELGNSLDYLLYLSYGLVAYYMVSMAAAILFFPKLIYRLLIWMSTLNWLKKGSKTIVTRANELFEASKEYRDKGMVFWLKLIALTYSVWIMKYLVINMVVAGFVSLTIDQHLLLVGRHLAMWLIMLVSPTPGSAGTAEFIFPAFFGEFLGDYTFAGGLIWRLLSFYPYLIIGALILPNWIKRVLAKSA
jgi:uncharacterized membrane protein YbhN (UPF0104 family)